MKGILSIEPKYQQLFSFNEELRKIVEDNWEKIGTIKTPTKAIIIFALTKGHKTHKASLILCDQGFGQDAAILVRSLFELAVICGYITKDKTGNKALRYMNYDWILRKKMFTYIQSKEHLVKLIKEEHPETDQVIEDILKYSKKADEEFDYEYFGWADKRLIEMSEDTGLSEVYKTVYRLQSQLAHSDPRVANEYIREENNKFIYESGASKRWVIEALVTSFHFYYLITAYWNETFNIGLNSKFDDLTKRYSNQVRIEKKMT